MREATESDLMGRPLWNQRLNIFSGTQTINIPTKDLSSGMYILQVRHERSINSMKVQLINRP